jgi:hypothetical protein
MNLEVLAAAIAARGSELAPVRGPGPVRALAAAEIEAGRETAAAACGVRRGQTVLATAKSVAVLCPLDCHLAAVKRVRWSLEACRRTNGDV